MATENESWQRYSALMEKADQRGDACSTADFYRSSNRAEENEISVCHRLISVWHLREYSILGWCKDLSKGQTIL